MARALGILLLAFTVGFVLTAGPCLDCVAKVTQDAHRCCGKPKPEPPHKCAAEAKLAAAEAKTLDAAPLAPALVQTVVVVLPELAPAEVCVAPSCEESPPIFLSLESLRC